MVHGQISAYSAGSEKLESYLERFDFYCAANKIDSDEAKKATFLSTIGAPTFEKAKELLSPQTVQQASYSVIIEKLKSHYKPQCIEIAERFKFFKRHRGSGECIADFEAGLRKLGSTCNFGSYLETALRDQFVCGLSDSKCQQDLLCSSDLSLASAVQAAKAREAVLREAELLGAGAAAVTHRVAPSGAGKQTPKDRVQVSGTTRPNKPCWRCGNTHRAPCRFTSYRCNVCRETGHLARCCPRGRRGGTHAIQEEEEREDEVVAMENVSNDSPVYMVQRTQVNVPPIWCPIRIGGTTVKMELDTGAGVTLIDEHTYRQIKPRPPLSACGTRLRSYSGDDIPVIGEFCTDVSHNGSVHRQLPVIVVAGSGPSLLGRNWLATMKLNWSEVHAVRTPPLERLKGKYPSVFRPELGELKDVELKLDIDRTVPPKFCKARSLPYAVKAKVEEQLDADISSGVLIPVKDSEWAAPIVPVIKAGGKVRVCANFKLTANRAVRLDRYPLPKVEDLFATLGGHSLFSKIDLAQAYNQLRVHEASRDVLTINTSRGLLQYSRLPFGVNCAGGLFQREIEKVLRGIPNVVVYLDDVLIASQTEEEHWRRLDLVFQRLESAGLRVRENKCLLMQPRVEYLGHKLDRSGIRPLDDKVSAILSTPAPSNVADLKSFLGLVTYYSRFIPQRAMMLAPLYDLLRKDIGWTWGRAEEESFQECKRKLAAKTLLVHFDASRDLILTCDASSRGIGAVLAHVGDGGEELPLSFASRRLTDSERKYSQIERGKMT